MIKQALLEEEASRSASEVKTTVNEMELIRERVQRKIKGFRLRVELGT